MALGDSTTEGLMDRAEERGGASDGAPSPDERYRGWADRLAELLAASDLARDLEYANLAVRGKLLPQIVEDQLDPALALRPDLLSLVGGGNDIIRGRDPDDLSRRLEEAVAAARAAGADVLMGTGYDTRGTPVLSRVRGRVGVLNANIWSIAERHGAFVLDFWGMRSLRDPRMWAPDRIHLNGEGHRRVALEAFAVLSRDRVPRPEWDEPLPPAVPSPLRERMAREARWARQYVGPWIGRRLRRVSSGDGRAAKYPQPRPIAPAAAPPE